MKRRLTAIFLAGAMTASLCAAPAAAYQDTQGHWAESAIDTWSSFGVLQGDNGGFRPNDSITRGEMAVVLTRLLGLTETDGTYFVDVSPEAWYADAIAKCAAAGILQGDNGMARPADTITRQEAMVMLGRALGIQEERNGSETYLDGEQVADWAAGYVNAMTNRGVVGGVGGNQLAPAAEINRASVVTILNNAITTYANQPGETVTVSGDGLTVVAAADVTLTGATDGDVLITAGASESSITLDGLTVGGTVNVSVPTAVTVSGDSEVAEVAVNAAAEVTVEENAKADTVTVGASDASIIISGEVRNVETAIGADYASVTVHETGTVEKISVAADDVSVAVEGKVEEVSTSAAGTDVSGSGKVEEVNAKSGASDITVSTPKTDINVSGNADGSVTVNNKEVKPGESGTTNSKGDNVSIDKEDDTSSYVPDYYYYTVTFVVDEETVDTDRVREGRSVSRPADPVKEGYTFVAWYLDGAVYDFAAPVNGNVTLTAQWVLNDYTVTLVGGGADITTGAQHGSALDQAALEQKAAVTGHHITGWYTDAEHTAAYDFTAPVTGDLTLYYVLEANEYTVSFGSDADAQTVKYGGNAIRPAMDPTKTGYTFGGWYADAEFAEVFDFETVITGDTTVYAKWDINVYTVTFNSNGGSEVDDQEVEHGGVVTEPTKPTKADAVFDGWYTEDTFETGYDFMALVTGDITLYAKWHVHNYTATPSAYAKDASETVVVETYTCTCGDSYDRETNAAAAQIGEDYYVGLENAIVAANGETVTLLKDAEVDSTITIDHELTLDLNGMTISSQDEPDPYFNVVESGKLTLCSSVAGGEIIQTKRDNAVIMLNDGGEMIMNSGTIISGTESDTGAAAQASGGYGICVYNDSSFTMNGGTISAGWFCVATNGTTNSEKPNYGNNAKITINDGTLTSRGDYAIYAPAEDGETIIKNGTITGDWGAIQIKRGTLTIYNGLFENTATAPGTKPGDQPDGSTPVSDERPVISADGAYGKVTLTISGGRFVAPENCHTIVVPENPKNAVTVNVTGGTYSDDYYKPAQSDEV